jgi:hypothetical protein
MSGNPGPMTGKAAGKGSLWPLFAYELLTKIRDKTAKDENN